MKILSSAFEHELKINRFVFRETEPTPTSQETQSEKLSQNDFSDKVLTDEQAKLKAENLIKKIQTTPKLQNLTREDIVKMISDVENQDKNPSNNDQKIGLEELAHFEANLKTLLETTDESMNGGSQKMEALEKKYGSFECIAASEFLKMSPEELQKLFLTGDENAGYTVDFKGNHAARRKIGMGDLFPNSPDFQYVKINGEVVKRSYSNGMRKVGYLKENGGYAPILGGEKIELKPSQEEIERYESQIKESGLEIKTFSTTEETTFKQTFLDNTLQEEKETEEIMEKFLEQNPEFGEIIADSSAKSPNEKKEVLSAKISAMSASEFIALRRSFGGDNLRKMMKSLGLNNENHERELISAANTVVKNLSQEPDYKNLIDVFGGEMEFKDVLMKLSEHETGRTMSPYNWSSTNCMGYFHFNWRNTKHYNINPCNPEDAVRGVMALMKDNQNFLGNRATAELILGAHNSGAGNALKNRSAGYGNPLPTEFAAKVQRNHSYKEKMA